MMASTAAMMKEVRNGQAIRTNIGKVISRIARRNAKALFCRVHLEIAISPPCVPMSVHRIGGAHEGLQCL